MRSTIQLLNESILFAVCRNVCNAKLPLATEINSCCIAANQANSIIHINHHFYKITFIIIYLNWDLTWIFLVNIHEVGLKARLFAVT